MNLIAKRNQNSKETNDQTKIPRFQKDCWCTAYRITLSEINGEYQKKGEAPEAGCKHVVDFSL